MHTHFVNHLTKLVKGGVLLNIYVTYGYSKKENGIRRIQIN